MNALILAILMTATPLTIEQYVGALERIDSLLVSNQLAVAQSEARALMNRDVIWKDGKFRTDSALLGAIAHAQRADGPHRARLLFAIDELRRVAGMEAGRADPKLLERIAAEQAVPDLPEGGKIATTIEEDLPLIERIARMFEDLFEWIGDRIEQFRDWLRDLLPSRRGGVPAGAGDIRWLVYLVVGAIVVVLLALAVKVLRNSRAAVPETTSSEPLGSKRDEDPLSRGATEWERYAATLASSGRFREASRAWYHAVLVTCYAAGILHFRKGRTNWEYISSLPPSLAWRADLIALTRSFEREWYGADESASEAHVECRDLAQNIIASIQRELRGAA